MICAFLANITRLTALRSGGVHAAMLWFRAHPGRGAVDGAAAESGGVERS